MKAQGLVQVLTNQHPASSHTEAECLLRNLKTAPFKSHSIVVIDDAVMLLGEDLLEIGSRIGQKGRPRLLGLNTEASIVQIDPIVPQKRIGGFYRRDLT